MNLFELSFLLFTLECSVGKRLQANSSTRTFSFLLHSPHKLTRPHRRLQGHLETTHLSHSLRAYSFLQEHLKAPQPPIPHSAQSC